jgi:hypothetical protein
MRVNDESRWGIMSGASFYEQGRSPGDWMNIEARVGEGKETAIVHDVADGRYEVWHNGHMVFGAASTFGEAQQVLSETLSKDSFGK